jgi:hypothetical protein
LLTLAASGARRTTETGPRRLRLIQRPIRPRGEAIGRFGPVPLRDTDRARHPAGDVGDQAREDPLGGIEIAAREHEGALVTTGAGKGVVGAQLRAPCGRRFPEQTVARRAPEVVVSA